MSEASKYRPDIDGLRAVAVLAVVAFHAAPGRLPGGFIGVDIFFVISGYLISSILLNSLSKDKFSILEFYQRRVRRIFPALLLVLVSCLLLGWFYLFADDFKLLGKHVVGGAGFVSNLVLWNESGYFDAAAESKPLLHLWSLGIEEQFYLFWPLFLWAMWKAKKYIGVVIAATLCISFILNIAYVETSPVSAFYSPFSRFWELMIGSILAYATSTKYNNDNEIALMHQHAISISGLFAIVVGLFVINKDKSFPGYWVLLPTIGTVMLIHAGPSALINKYVLSNRLFIWFGLISYPLYLWHWPLLAFPKIIIGELSQLIKLSIVIASIGLAWLTYQYIEKPVRNSSAPKALAISLAISMLFLAVIGFVLYKSDGFVGHGIRKEGTQQYLDFFENSMPKMAYFERNSIQKKFRQECDFYDMTSRVNGIHTLIPMGKIDKKCYTRNYKYSNSIFIWGDSHAQQFNYGLTNNLPGSWQILQVASSGCQPDVDNNYDIYNNYCHKSNSFALQSIINAKPDVVLIAQASHHNSAQLIKIVNKLKNIGIQKILIIGPVPNWSPDLPKIIARNLWVDLPERTKTGLNSKVLEINYKLKNEIHTTKSVVYVDAISAFCNSDGCLIRIGQDSKKNITSWDYGHLTPIASDYFAKYYLVNLIKENN